MKRRLRRLAALLMAVALAASMTGCWGKHELTDLFFVTGISLDKSDEPGKIDFAFQVATPQSASSGGSGSGGSSSSQNASLLLKASESTMGEAESTINRDASREVFIHHNQVILFGSDLAKEGLDEHIDMLLRNQESRMDVPIAVIDGNAENVLSQEMEQDKISGSYLSKVLDSLAIASPEIEVTLLDFISRFIDDTTAPVMPILIQKEEGGIKKIEMRGMAIFKGGKMIGSIDALQTLGYAWSMGDVKETIFAASSDQGRVVFQVETLDCEHVVTLKDDGNVGVTLKVNANLLLNEIVGFEEIPEKDLIDYLTTLANNALRDQIVDTFEAARALDADIYGFGAEVHKKYKTAWKTMEENWDALFQDIDLDVQVASRLPSSGKIIQTIEMEAQQ